MPFPPTWTIDEAAPLAARELVATDFAGALDLLHAIGAIAEELDHHPDLHLTGYKRVRIETVSHDVGELTARDERLAARIEVLLAERGLA